MSARRWWLAAVIAALAVAVSGCGGGRRLVGTDLGKTPAPDFTLRDASGAPFTLRDLRGRAVLLTFLYTHCPDICPALAGKLSEVYAQLGSAQRRVSFVAVSVDPGGDTPESIAQFTIDHGLTGMGTRFRYGIGSHDELSAVWRAYYVGASPRPAALSALAASVPQPTAVDHEAVLYLIDREGRERVLLRPDVSIRDLVNDLKAIAGS